MKKPYFQYFFDISLISQEIVDNQRTNNDQHKIPYKIESFQERSNDLHVTMGGSWWKHPYTTHTFRNLFLISIENYLQAELSKARLQEKDIDEERLEGKLC